MLKKSGNHQNTAVEDGGRYECLQCNIVRNIENGLFDSCYLIISAYVNTSWDGNKETKRKWQRQYVFYFWITFAYGDTSWDGAYALEIKKRKEDDRESIYFIFLIKFAYGDTSWDGAKALEIRIRKEGDRDSTYLIF